MDWINLTGAKKVHSLIDKVYKRKNLEMAWEKVKENRGSGGVNGQSARFVARHALVRCTRTRVKSRSNVFRTRCGNELSGGCLCTPRS